MPQHPVKAPPLPEDSKMPLTQAVRDAAAAGAPRHDWSEDRARVLADLPFMDLVFLAQSVHRLHFNPNEVQMSTLLSVKTGGCQEDCAYCSQSAAFETGLKATKLMAVQAVISLAGKAKQAGASRYCMGAAWRAPKERDMAALCAMIEGVKAMGLETCMTLGMLTPAQAQRLKRAGLDYYNHNIDTSEEFYDDIITTRTYQDRLETLGHVRAAGINVCCGGILGVGESREDRLSMLVTLANLPRHPESVPINRLVPVVGTPLQDAEPVTDLDFVRTIALARLMMPGSVVRLSAGRQTMSDTMQALCFLAGANSIFVGEKLLTTGNPDTDSDTALFARLGLTPARPSAHDSHQMPSKHGSF